MEHPYYGWLGSLLKRSCNIKLLVHSHNIESLRFKSTGRWWWRILWNYEQFTYRIADINFFISNEDREFAINNFSLNAAACHTITYGFEREQQPTAEEKLSAKNTLRSLHGISNNEKILLFNGTLDYKPNQDAINVILNNINPLLQSHNNFNYKIIICGRGLPESFNKLEDHKAKNIIYAGFVDDIDIYFKGADIFINPVLDGGGIKTKLVEALGHGLSCVSTSSGAYGIPQSITANKLTIVADDDWHAFVKGIISADIYASIGQAFFDHFYWGNIAQKAKHLIN